MFINHRMKKKNEKERDTPDSKKSPDKERERSPYESERAGGRTLTPSTIKTTDTDILVQTWYEKRHRTQKFDSTKKESSKLDPMLTAERSRSYSPEHFPTKIETLRQTSVSAPLEREKKIDYNGIAYEDTSEVELRRLIESAASSHEFAPTSAKSSRAASLTEDVHTDMESKTKYAKGNPAAMPPFDKTADGEENLQNLSAVDSYYSDYVNEEPRGDDMLPKPKWHPPWQLKHEIIAHEDAIPVLVIDPTNQWFATGSSDNMIKIWDIEEYRPKLMIKAHKQSIRSMAFGTSRHRYLYSTGDDRQLLCHDVEVNRVISRYKGQSTVIYGMCMYAPQHILVVGARDKLVKLYDTRSTKLIKQLGGHQNTVSCVHPLPNTQQIISGSHDGTLRLWDIGEGKCTGVLYGHAKSIRAMCQHPEENTILSASSERILAWDIDTTEIVQEIPAKDIAINSITINRLGVTVAGGSNGVMHLWDFKSGFRFQKIHRNKVYESQEIPICVFATRFDLSGTKLICAGACNVVKIYQEAFTRFKPYVEHNINESTSSLGNKTSSSVK